ncbi:MAG: inorganic phosphate transporter [bacterium]
MGVEIFLAAVVILIAFAVFDLIVGVSNDAVNFLSSAIGSKAAPLTVIMIVASLGILAGVTFSSGMMEVARKGIFHPKFFTMPELMIIFLAVMLTDIILLDIFNTLGLPTSTTVSIVFELLGGAVAVSILKIMSENGSLLAVAEYINTAKAMIIIFGILLSVAVSFFFGTVIQFFSRLLFTFDFMPRLKKFGALWGGMALASIVYFILIKGAKGASFIPSETADFFQDHVFQMLFYTFIASAMVLQILIFLKINILKPIILIGTFALAMAFAANDLVNFIGVPMAGLYSYKVAVASGNPLIFSMGALSEKVHSQTWVLLIAGVIMAVTLWKSKKARSVTETSLQLGQQEEGTERFESALFSRFIVSGWMLLYGFLKTIVPPPVRSWANRRIDPSGYHTPGQGGESQRFDLIRASVNLMVASAVISFATSYKLPLSTTYVTFMVAMGTSFADQAWGRESAVYRITGVLTVIGGWFMTALSAFIISSIFALIIFKTSFYGVPVLVVIIALIIRSNHKKHAERAQLLEHDKIFNLRKIKDAPASIATTFEHMGILSREIRISLEGAVDALFEQDQARLRLQGRRVKKIQNWSNIIVANIFKSMRLLHQKQIAVPTGYAQVIRRLQHIVDCYRDLVMRSKAHVDNHHKGLIAEQMADLKEIKTLTHEVVTDVEAVFSKRRDIDYNTVLAKDKKLLATAAKLEQDQIGRIVSLKSKTRLSILYYAIIEDCLTISKQNLRLLEIFNNSFGAVKQNS